MSQAPVVRFRDPRVAIERAPIVALDQGAEFIDLRRQNSSAYSKDAITFTELSTGGSGMILDRKMFVEYAYVPSFQIQSAGAQANNAILYGNNTSSTIHAFGAAVTNQVYFDPSAYAGQAYDPAAGATYIPAIPAAERCRNSFNNILAMIGLGGPHRSVGPRSLGLLQATKNLEVKINGQTINQSVAHYINALEWYDNHGPSDHTDYSKCASYPDLFKTYKEGVYAQTNPLGAYGTQLGRETRGALWPLPNNSIVSNVDPVLILGPVGGNATPASGYYCIDGFAFQIISHNANRIVVGHIYPTTEMAQVYSTNVPSKRPIVMVEPIVLPVFNIGEPQSRGLYGVDKFSVDFGLSSGIVTQKLWSGDVLNVKGAYDGDLYHNIVTDIVFAGGNNAAYLHYNLLRPHLLPELPVVNTYQSKQLNVRPILIGRIGFDGIEVGKSSDAISGNIEVGSVPSRVYVYIKEMTDSTQIQDTDTFSRIDQIGFQFSGFGKQFTACKTEQLYHMCRESGLKMSLPQWRDHVGSVVCIDFTKNVNLGLTDYAGQLGQFRFDFEVKYTPLRAVQRDNGVYPDLVMYIVTVEEGVVTISNNACIALKGTLQTDITNIPVRYRDYDQKWANIYGGSFVDGLKKVAHTVGTVAQKGIQVGKTVAPYVKKALPYVEKGLEMTLPLLALAAGAGVSENKARKLAHEFGEEKAIKMLKKMQGGGVVGGAKKIKGGRATSKAEMSKFLNAL